MLGIGAAINLLRGAKAVAPAAARMAGKALPKVIAKPSLVKAAPSAVKSLGSVGTKAATAAAPAAAKG